jgi:hypothetical protein
LTWLSSPKRLNTVAIGGKTMTFSYSPGFLVTSCIVT